MHRLSITVTIYFKRISYSISKNWKFGKFVMFQPTFLKRYSIKNSDPSKSETLKNLTPRTRRKKINRLQDQLQRLALERSFDPKTVFFNSDINSGTFVLIWKESWSWASCAYVPGSYRVRISEFGSYTTITGFRSYVI